MELTKHLWQRLYKTETDRANEEEKKNKEYEKSQNEPSKRRDSKG